MGTVARQRHREAGIEYTVLDDYHFRNAGLQPQQLHGYYVTERRRSPAGRVPRQRATSLSHSVRAAHETVDYLRSIADQFPNSVCVFGDDGESSAPGPIRTSTFTKTVGCGVSIRRAVGRIVVAAHATTLAESVDSVPPVGKIYLPDASYREMTEWALPADRLVEYDHLTHDMEHDPRWAATQAVRPRRLLAELQGEVSRTDEMYARLLMVSRRLQEAIDAGYDVEWSKRARRELYKGQCNCGYWHGAFAAFICRTCATPCTTTSSRRTTSSTVRRPAAKRAATSRGSRPCTATSTATPGKKSACRTIASSPWFLRIAAAKSTNSTSGASATTCWRRWRVGPRRITARCWPGANQNQSAVASIHDRIVFMQPNLDQRIRYDSYTRKALQDHFFDNEATPASRVAGQAQERGDFLVGGYEAKLRRNPHRIQVLHYPRRQRLGRAAQNHQRPDDGDRQRRVLDIAYLIEGLPPGRAFHFASEFNLAGLP